MVKASVVVPAALPVGFSVTNIAVKNGQVTLSWQQGTPWFQVQANNGWGWNNCGGPMTNRSCSIPAKDAWAMFRVQSLSNCVLWVDPNGNDSTGTRGMRDKPFKSVYNCQDTNTHTFYGAIPAARGGDTVVVLPGKTFSPAVPLNNSATGLNLYVSAGATLIRTNKYFKQDGTIQSGMVGNASVGPFIIPGNNSQVVVDGQVLATNSPSDAILGWWDSADTTGYGYTNRIATNVFLSGNGTLSNTLDGVYCNQRSPFVSSLYVSNLTMSGLYDNFYVHGNCDLFTKNLKTIVGEAQNHSRGLAIESGVVWTDSGSAFCCGGGSVTYPLSVGPSSSATLSGTHLQVLTANTISTNSGSLSPYFYYDPNAIVDGSFVYTDQHGNSTNIVIR